MDETGPTVIEHEDGESDAALEIQPFRQLSMEQLATSARIDGEASTCERR